MDDRIRRDRQHAERLLHREIERILHVILRAAVLDALFDRRLDEPAEQQRVGQADRIHGIEPAKLLIAREDVLEIRCPAAPMAENEDRVLLDLRFADALTVNERFRRRRGRERERRCGDVQRLRQPVAGDAEMVLFQQMHPVIQPAGQKKMSGIDSFHGMASLTYKNLDINVAEECELNVKHSSAMQRFYTVLTLFTGSETVKRLPSPGRLSAAIVPPCSSTMRLQSVSPSPQPSARRSVSP